MNTNNNGTIMDVNALLHSFGEMPNDVEYTVVDNTDIPMSAYDYPEDASFAEQMAHLDAEMDKTIAANKLAVSSREAKQLKTIARLINANRLIKMFGGMKNPIGFQLIAAAKEMISGWNRTKYENTGKPCTPYITYLETTCNTNAAHCMSHFLDAYDTISNYPEVKDFDNGLDIGFSTNGLIVTVQEGTSIDVKDGNTIYVDKTIRTNLNGMILKPGILDALIRVNIHEYLDEAYRVAPIRFGNNLLFKLVMLVDAGINLDALIEGKEYTMVCGYKGNQLTAVKVPSYTLFSIYGQHGAIPTTKAKIGLVGPVKTIPMLIEYYTTKANPLVAVTRESTNKTMARLDKQDSKTTGWVIENVELIVCADGTHVAKHYASTGSIFMPEAFMLKYGFCRITSTMANGGLKGATAPLCMLDPHLDTAVVFPSAFKGGLLAAYLMDKGVDSEIKNLIDLNFKTKEEIKQFEQSYLETWGEEFINGKFVKCKRITVDLRITNAYTAESIKPVYEVEKPASAMEDAIGMLEKQIDKVDEVSVINGFRDSLMYSIINEDLSVGDYLRANLRKPATIRSITPMTCHMLLIANPAKELVGDIKWKSKVTRVIAPELQSVHYWHGMDEEGNSHARNWMESLVNNGINSNSSAKHYGIEYLKGVTSDLVVNTLNIRALAKIYVEEMTLAALPLKHKYTVYPRTMIIKLVEALCGFGHESGWVELMYGTSSALLPANYLLYGDIDLSEGYHSPVEVASGLLPDIIEAIIVMLVDDGSGTILSNVDPIFITGSLNSVVQQRLLGKEFGRLYTKGGYKIILPFPHMRKNEIICLNRDTYVMSSREFINVNLTKMPANFFQATAGFKCRKTIPGVTLSPEMALLLADCVFMHPDAILEMQNDADGDAARVTFDSYILPMYGSNGGVFGQFNGKFHKDFVVDEVENNQLRLKGSSVSTMYDLHKAVWESANAKDLVAKYTSNKYAYEFAMPFVSEFEDNEGTTHIVTDAEKLTLSIFLGELVQTEAMDNIKLEGSETHLSESIMYFALANPKLAKKETLEQGLNRVQKYARMQMIKYLKDKGYNITNIPAFCHKMTSYLQAVALSLDTHLDTFKIFSDRAMVNNVLSHRDSDLDKFFNAYGMMEEVKLEGVDEKSMYHHLLCEYDYMYSQSM